MSDPLLPGSVIRDRYEVQSLIGQGGMGAVYRVSDRRLPGRTCALKAVRTSLTSITATDEAARQQFLMEAKTLACLDHPNLPKVSDYFTLDEHDCLVMDYVPGQDLQQRVQEARRNDRFLALRDALDWTQQLCDVIAYLHEQQPPVIHGDIKPANIKLTADGRVKLVDFGLVRPGDPADPRTLTGIGLHGVGSLPYAALEQYAGNPSNIGPRADLYSLGATLYHLVTNLAPASAHDRFLDPSALTPPRQINEQLPPHVEKAILAAMQPHPKDRPASVSEWQALLAEGLPALPARPVKQQEFRWAGALRENAWYVLLAGFSLLAAIGLTFLR